MRRAYLADLYAPLSHKSDLGDGVNSPRPLIAPSWVDDLTARRLTAYHLLHAYATNVSRYHLPSTYTEDQVSKFREYGHAGLLVAQGRSLLLGEEQTLRVDGTQGETPDPRAVEVLGWLSDWASDERLWLKLLEAEGDAVELGDGVYVLGWDPAAGRPRLRVFEPDAYHPVTGDDGGDEDFPRKVHIAYEEAAPNGTSRLRRITWELVELETPRRYPWQASGESTTTCLLSDATWDLSAVKAESGLFDLSDAAATWRTDADGEVRRRDLGVDFIPIVHVPNTPTGADHFGASLLLLVAQLLDDLNGADTDLAMDAEVVASTPTVTRGAEGAPLTAGPGARWDLPDGGTATLLDTSRVLDARLKQIEHLLDALSVNSRLAAALLGRVKPNEVPSGYALELGFAATRSLVREMRAVRVEKYPILLRFALRLAMVGGALKSGPLPKAEITFGAYLPADLPAAVALVQALLPVHAISRETGVRILQEAGLPIDDAAAEVERIAGEAFADAVELVDATGDVAAARKLLGLPPVQPPVPTLPPGP